MERVFAEEFVSFGNAPEPAPNAPPYRELVYSCDYGNVHFTSILSNYWYTNRPGQAPGYRQGWVDDIQLAWLRQDLAAARARGMEHLVVFTHEPGYPNGGHVRDGMYWNGKIPEVNDMRETFWKILGEAKVLAFLAGDEHNYSRLLVDENVLPGIAHPVWQIISGGAGAPFYTQDTSVPWAGRVACFDVRAHVCLFRVNGPAVTITVKDRTGGVIETAVLTAK
jgi:hypothetical protein